MTVKIGRISTKIDKSDVEKLEMCFGHKLPDDYKEFMCSYNGGVPEANVFQIKEINNSCGVNKLLSCHEVIEEKKRLGNRIPEKIIPVAFAECGNFVCLSVEIDRKGIYFWDHELEVGDKELPSWKNLFFLTASFSDFLKILEKFDQNKIEVKPEQVISIKTTPALLEIIRKQQEEIQKKDKID